MLRTGLIPDSINDEIYRKTTLHCDIVSYGFMFNSGRWWGSSIKGLNTRIKGEHKVRNIDNGRNIAWLMEIQLID